MIVGIVATLYGIWLVYAAGLDYLLMSTVLFAPGILVYFKARQERAQRTFSAAEAVVALVILAAALVAAWMMWTGRLSPL